MAKNIFQQNALIRAKEAKVLFQNELYDGAYYFAGYCIELAIKAYICDTKLSSGDFTKKISEEIFTHDLAGLLKSSGLKSIIDSSSKKHIFYKKWGVIKDWNNEVRYKPNTPLVKAKNMINACFASYGIFPWIKSRWGE